MEIPLEQQQDLQLELFELQTDPFFLSMKNELHGNVWKHVPQDWFPNLRLCTEAVFSVQMHIHLQQCSLSKETYEVKTWQPAGE